ncbi:hypothetical protein Vafri_1148 [Volvox africanus]|nr:hypothetical protein Vafri_1148 [Volvox africanus]
MKPGSEKKVSLLASSCVGEDSGEKKCGGSGAISSFDSDPSGTGARKVSGRGVGLDCRRINFRDRATRSRLKADAGRLRTRPSVKASVAVTEVLFAAAAIVMADPAAPAPAPAVILLACAALTDGCNIIRRDHLLSTAVLPETLSWRLPPSALPMTFPASPAVIARLGDGCSNPPAPPFGAPPIAAAAAAALDVASGSPDNKALMSSKPARATAASSPSPSPPSPPSPPPPPPPPLPPTGFVVLTEGDGSALGLPGAPVSHKSRTDSGSGVSCDGRGRDGES